ncbi:hypothetical protein [Winogradskyella sp.]|uniref:hypothetical protein n=1 Tax=Winogradskyella sp. TaxID=1883156 RepID=UPI003515255F
MIKITSNETIKTDFPFRYGCLVFNSERFVQLVGNGFGYDFVACLSTKVSK